MIWVTIILGIIEAIPGIIKLIQEILAAIHGHPIGMQAKLWHEFTGHLLAWWHSRDNAALEASLHMMGRGLGCASAHP